MSGSEISVTHDAKKKVFVIDTPGHDRSFLEYDFTDSNGTTVDMFETYVPETLRGQGVAKHLADAAFEWAVKNKIKVKLSCWYLDGYLKRHPRNDISDLVT